MKIATISSKGQITLPRSLMRELDVKPKQKVFIQRTKDAIVVKPMSQSVVDELAGSLTKYVDPSKLGKSWKAVMEETKKKTADRLAKEGITE